MAFSNKRITFLNKNLNVYLAKYTIQIEFLKIESYFKCPGEAHITGNSVMNVFASEE